MSDDATCYIERSSVREILIASDEISSGVTWTLLAEIDKLPITTMPEVDRQRAALTQIRGFVKVMDENNWRDLRLHIERQCAVEQLGDQK